MDSNSKALDSFNIGFQLLKKSGWKEGTGLGAYEQGRLDPIEAQIKKNKCGIGAEKRLNRERLSKEHSQDFNKEKPEKKQNAMSKRMRRMQHEEERLKEKEFDQAFFREFWPDNV